MNAIPPLAPTVASVRATARQREASDPAVSAFVAASAGSGKTKLLIDRLLRLMLEGAEPSRILCLTFTKAAAAEMALRLQSILGKWVTLDEPALVEELKIRGITPKAEVVARARALFARVLDLPGGMRISTIHAFCQSLLRRFPLEAALAPHFRLLEDADGRAELLTAREDAMAEAEPAALATIAGLVRDSDFGRLVADLRPHAAKLRPLLALPGPARLARVQRAAGVSGTDAELVGAAAAAPNGELRAAVAQLKAHGTAGEQALAESLSGWLDLTPGLRAEHWDEWLRLLLTAAGEPRKAGGFCKGKWAKSEPWIAAACVAEAERVAAVEDSRRALRVATVTDALLVLAAPVLAGFERRKRLAGLLDYDDLIARTSALLLDPGSAWVLFKLDGGLDHLLLDEVQDTAPEQWAITGALTAEFFAGEAAHDGIKRTVFAVGDRKQSIYSFQGADPAGFDHWRDRMRAEVHQAGGEFRDTVLDVSFRSTAAVLDLVDKVFEDGIAARGVVAAGETLRHEAHRAGHAGRVELWPLVPRSESEPPEPWAVADRNHGLTTAPQRLADALAHWIAHGIGRTPLPSRGRTLQAGDVLVLVRRRDDFARSLVRRLKALGVPVAGLDRLTLTEQPAVQDLLALCDTLLLPGDDLSLACVLTSPLGGLADDDLMALAIGRDGSLWSALRQRRAERPGWEQAIALIEALLARADFTTPHALLVEALGPLGGRMRLLARLGPEAAEPIDELVSAAMAYAGSHPPSLQGFVHWLRQSGAEVKRQAEEAGHTVRVMTVHGAKGLQAPLVILPDTASLPPDGGGLVWSEGCPLWSPTSKLRCAAVDRLRAAAEQARMQEYNRLLYVALTRAEDQLLVCGWETRQSLPEESWHAAIGRGMARLQATEQALPQLGDPWPGAALVWETEQRARPALSASAVSTEHPALPAWAGRPPAWTAAAPLEPARPVPLAPSRPADIHLGPLPPSASPLSNLGAGGAAERGTLIHRLLQHVPADPDGREAAIAGYLRLVGAPAAIAAEVLAIVDHPALAALFGPGSRAEQPLAGEVGGLVISGVVDRLAVLPDAVLLADFKTGRDAPSDPAATPVLYLRQLAAYRALLRQVFPDRPVRCALVWTRTASVMAMPDELLDGHAPARA